MTETRTADTSVVVPALSGWHAHHEGAAAAVAGVTRLPAQVVVETIAVLTRLPGGIAVDPRTAVEVVRASFPDDPFVLSARALAVLLDQVGESAIRGGELYDAVVAATALEAGTTLVSRDARAERVYRAVGVPVELIA